MKKTLQLVLVAVLAVTMFFGFVPTKSYAAVDVQNVIEKVNNAEENEVDMGEAANIGGRIVNALWWISIIVAIVALTVIGLKYIIGSTQEKAEYKKSLIPLVVGILVVVFATTIVNVIFGIR